MNSTSRVGARTSFIELVSNWIRSQAAYLGMLGLLLALGAAGHWNHWSIPGITESHQDVHSNSKSLAAITPEEISHSDQAETLKPSIPSIQQVSFRAGSKIEQAGLKTEQANLTTLSKEIVVSAEVEYNRHRTVDLSSRVPGVIYHTCATWGQFVERGQILAIVDAADVGRLKSEFAKALFERNLKRISLERYRQAGESIPLRLVTEAEGALQAANVTLLSAEQAIINLGLNLDVREFDGLAENDVIRKLRTLGLEGEWLEKIERETSSSNLLPIRSPINGVLIGSDIALGESVGPDRSFLQVSDVSRVWVTFKVRKEDASLIRVGQSVEFTPDGHTDSIRGAVNWISTEVDERTRTLLVRSEVENPSLCLDHSSGIDVYMLRANMFGNGRIEVQRESGIAVSRDCIHFDNGKPMVFVRASESAFVPCEVELGLSGNGIVQIKGKIAHGSEVASLGSQMLKSELALSRLQAGQ